MNAPTVTRTPDGAILLDTAMIDHWAGVVQVLSDNPSLRVHVLRACRSGDGRLKAYAAWRLSEACETAMQTILDDTQAADLAEQLDAARQTPDECMYCQEDAAGEVSGIHMCAGHVKAHDSLAEIGVEGK